MAFKKYSTEQLKKWQKILLAFAIIGVISMVIALVYGMSDNNESLILMVPTVFSALAFIPIAVSSVITTELNKRTNKDK